MQQRVMRKEILCHKGDPRSFLNVLPELMLHSVIAERNPRYTIELVRLRISEREQFVPKIALGNYFQICC